MKRFLLTAATCLMAWHAPVAQAAETYTLDTNHTNIVFHINHFGFSNPSGKFPGATGTLVLDEAHPAQSHVEVRLAPGDVMTGIPALDEHLKTKDFFDVAAYPTATFQSDRIEMTGQETANIHGMLTLHGVTKPIVLKARLNKIGENMFHKKTAGFSATATLKRSDFGMTTYLPGLGDEVQLQIDVEANLADKQAS